ncbi:MAG: hypothetical protein M3015_12770 [Bacteroidota bacterium]|nr:hypothetical protein [Bacteroidota bacterium]
MVGLDRSSILTVPRYASESSQKDSTWQTTAWNNSAEYVNAAFSQGIELPVGMCLQDGPSEAQYYQTALNVNGALQWNDKTYSWPIPQAELNSNAKIAGQQNPGY